MKRRLKTIAFILISTFLIASPAFSLGGYVRYKGSKAPASYALIVFKNHGKEVSRVLTDDNGFYFIKLPKGNYGVVIKHKKKSKNKNLRIKSHKDRHDFSI